MAEQISLGGDAVSGSPELDAARSDHTQEVAADLAYRRLGIVNVVFYGSPGAGDRGWVLIDAGLRGTADFVQDAAARRFGEGSRPAAIVVTHGHFDHVGALETLAEGWDVPVYAHPLERPYLDGSAAYPSGDPAVGGGAIALLSRFYSTRPVDVGARLWSLPEDGTVPFMPGWRWIHTPGHSVGHVALWREGDRILISGDAVVSTGQESAYEVAVQEPEMHGPPMYFTHDWQVAEESLKSLAALDPELVVTSHGKPLGGARTREALHRLAREFRWLAVPKRGRSLADPRRAADGSAYKEP